MGRTMYTVIAEEEIFGTYVNKVISICTTIKRAIEVANTYIKEVSVNDPDEYFTKELCRDKAYNRLGTIYYQPLAVINDGTIRIEEINVDQLNNNAIP